MGEPHHGEAEIRGNEEGHDPAADIGEDEWLVVADVVRDELQDDASGRPQQRHLVYSFHRRTSTR